MKEQELWAYLSDKRVASAKPFDREFLWVAKDDFEIIQEFFIEEYNILQKGRRSLRSRGYIAHIHAVEQGEHMLVHRDMGNVARFLPLGVIHLFADVLPYVVLARVKRVPFQSLFAMPE